MSANMSASPSVHLQPFKSLLSWKKPPYRLPAHHTAEKPPHEYAVWDNETWVESDVLYLVLSDLRQVLGLFLSVSYLDQQSDGATLVHLQDLSILGPHQDVAMAQRYGTYGGVVLQEQSC